MMGIRSKLPVKLHEAGPHLDERIVRCGQECGRWPKHQADMEFMPLSFSGVVATVGIVVVGYAYYERLTPGRWKLETVAVTPAWRRCGVGRVLVSWVAKRAASAGVASLVLAVSEAEYTAHRFLASCGFAATAVLFDRAGRPSMDRYRFKMELAPRDEAACMGVWP